MKGKQLITLPNKGNIIFRLLYVFLSSTLICLHRFCSSRLAMYICGVFLIAGLLLFSRDERNAPKHQTAFALSAENCLKRTATLWSLCFPFHPAQNGQHIGQLCVFFLFCFFSKAHFIFAIVTPRFVTRCDNIQFHF